ncbi:MAG: fasciclin domain-containing protein [Bacteroidaceae bacterium]|nr:fasciclin domain-containing protein [Bacteroidaceae bacterium]
MENRKTRWMSALLVLTTVLTACQDYMSEYYRRPDWIKGNCYEVLEADGNYSIFLRGIERAGYRDMVDGKSIVTVMAPNDDAFRAYFAENGISSIDEMDIDELDKLIGFHLMYYSYSADKLINFRPEEGDDVTDEEKEINAGMYYKHRTKSRDRNTTEFDNTRQTEVTIYHQERFLPTFSYKYFNTKLIDAEENYRYFFPGTEWNPTGIGFNVANAAVTKGNQITKNGYVHEIDHVLRPLNTIFDELRADENFSQFLALYRQYEYYAYDPDLTQEYGNGERLYQHLFTKPMANIACEWPSTDYSKLTTLSSVGYSIFAPTNAALDNFFNNYWAKGGYASLSQVSRESVQKLLFNCVYVDDIAFPEELRRGDIENSYGTVINVDLDAVPQKYRILCENGLLYGCEELAVPAMFAAVTGPAYQYKAFSYYLMMLTSIGEIQNTLWSDETRMLSLMPDNSQVEAMGISYDARNEYLVRDGRALGADFKTSASYAHLVDLSQSTCTDTELDSVSGKQQVFRAFSPDVCFYWYVQDGKISNSFRFNERIYPQQRTDEEVFLPFHELKSYRDDGTWSNGKAYSYEGAMFVGMPSLTVYKSFQQMAENNKIDESLPYYAFTNLLITAEMYTGAKYNFFQEGDMQLMLIPTNDAVTKAIKADAIPGMTFDAEKLEAGENLFDCIVVFDMESLQAYLKQFFIPLSSAGITNYPYLGWAEDTSKGMETLNTEEIYDEATSRVTYRSVKVVIADKGSKLTARLLDSNREIDFCPDYHYLPFVFNDGCVQFIEGMF